MSRASKARKAREDRRARQSRKHRGHWRSWTVVRNAPFFIFAADGTRISEMTFSGRLSDVVDDLWDAALDAIVSIPKGSLDFSWATSIEQVEMVVSDALAAALKTTPDSRS